MSNSYSLEDLKKDLDVEFAPVKLTLGDDEFVLRNLMRLAPNQRAAVVDAMTSVTKGEDKGDDLTGEEVAELENALTTMLANLPDGGKGAKLVEFVGGDIQLGMKIITLWIEHTQPGEAENSPA